MTTALTPALALDYVLALSADIVDGVVLDAQGALLAGGQALAAPARAILATTDAPRAHGATGDGQVYAARDGMHAIVVVTGRFALPRLTRHDLDTALTALGGQTPPEGASGAPSEAATRALITAAQDAFRRPRAVSRSE